MKPVVSAKISSLWSQSPYILLFFVLTLSEIYVAAIHLGSGILLPLLLVASFLIGKMKTPFVRFFLLFSIPTVGALPALVTPALPFNYIPALLMVVVGVALARPKTFITLNSHPVFRLYRLWLLILSLSTVFVYLRWSTLTEGAVRLFPDLATSPQGDRLSFTLLFPLLTLCLYAIAPLLLGLKEELDLSLQNCFIPMSAGFFISFLLAAGQHFFKSPFLTRAAWLEFGFANGASSDFNGLGLVSGLLFFLAMLLLIPSPHVSSSKPLRLIAGATLLPCLLAAYWSDSRTALLIFIVVMAYILFSYRRLLLSGRRRWFISFALLLILLAAVTQPALRHKVSAVFAPALGQNWQANLDYLSNGRLTMLFDGLDTARVYALSGIGPGNYLFYQRHKHFGHYFLHDLPLNQFLLILLEGGLLSLGLFLFWLWGWWKRRQKPWGWVMTALCLTMCVGTPLWLPEGMVLFWLAIAWGSPPITQAPAIRQRLWPVGLLLLLIILPSQIIHFRSLDPSQWQIKHNLLNEYGLWDADPGMEKVFRWSRHKSGFFVCADSSHSFKISCGAPLKQLPDKRQIVTLFWQGRPYQRLIFTQAQDKVKTVTLPAGQPGWLELVVEPVFNLKDMNLGPETRTLGVQIHF